MSEKRAAKQARRDKRRAASRRPESPEVTVRTQLIGKDFSVHDALNTMLGGYVPDPSRSAEAIDEARRAFNQQRGYGAEERTIEMLREDYDRFGRDEDLARIREYEAFFGA